MRLPAALAPLRHPLFRMLWSANLVVSLGVWLQNTGAGWLMTSLAADALTVSMVQAATVLPVFLLALPAGAVADIVDRRLFILGTQAWMLLAASLLAVLTLTGHITIWNLLALTFAIGVGSAANSPAYGSVMAEAVPRNDLVQAIALNGVGFNLARAVGPAIAGVLLLFGGPALTFGLNAISYLAVIIALLTWHRRRRASALPREQLISAMRVGMRFVRYTPTMRAAMVRSAAFYGPAAAPWAMLPLIVRQQLGMGAGIYGMLLGLMGVGGVTAGLLLPQVRNHFSRGNIVVLASLTSCTGMAIVALSHHWLPAALGMLLFGLGWVGAGSVAQGAAQLASPPWVRSRALAIYQLSFNGAMILGTFFWGWLATRFGLTYAMLAATGTGLVLCAIGRAWDIDSEPAAAAHRAPTPPPPEEVAPELVSVVRQARARVLESQHYRIDPARQEAFLSVMAEVRDARGRCGAVDWQLYEDVAHPEGWLEIWSVESWTDHLREALRMGEEDRAILARAAAFHVGPPLPPMRYLAVPPHRLPVPRLAAHSATGLLPRRA
jgi:MFS family permease